MIKTSIIAVALFMSANVSAQPEQPAQPVALNCESFADVATAVMEARQAEVPMREMIEKANGDILFEYLIDEAYKYSVLSSPEYKLRYINQFTDRIYQECRAVNKKKAQEYKQKQGQRV